MYIRTLSEVGLSSPEAGLFYSRGGPISLLLLMGAFSSSEAGLSARGGPFYSRGGPIKLRAPEAGPWLDSHPLSGQGGIFDPPQVLGSYVCPTVGVYCLLAT
jgi:hypothetical protein